MRNDTKFLAMQELVAQIKLEWLEPYLDKDKEDLNDEEYLKAVDKWMVNQQLERLNKNIDIKKNKYTYEDAITVLLDNANIDDENYRKRLLENCRC